MGWVLSLGPAGKGRGNKLNGAPVECGVPEFGGKALGECVWVGLRPSALEGVSEGVSKCRGGALGAVSRGGACALHGRREALSPTFSPRVSPVAAGPLTMGESSWV